MRTYTYSVAERAMEIVNELMRERGSEDTPRPVFDPVAPRHTMPDHDISPFDSGEPP